MSGKDRRLARDKARPTVWTELLSELKPAWLSCVRMLAVFFQFLVMGFIAWGIGQVAHWWVEHGLAKPVASMFSVLEWFIAAVDCWMLAKYCFRHAFHFEKPK